MQSGALDSELELLHFPAYGVSWSSLIFKENEPHNFITSLVLQLTGYGIAVSRLSTESPSKWCHRPVNIPVLPLFRTKILPSFIYGDTWNGFYITAFPKKAVLGCKWLSTAHLHWFLTILCADSTKIDLKSAMVTLSQCLTLWVN